jgi:hypothetical protein
MEEIDFCLFVVVFCAAFYAYTQNSLLPNTGPVQEDKKGKDVSKETRDW